MFIVRQDGFTHFHIDDNFIEALIRMKGYFSLQDKDY